MLLTMAAHAQLQPLERKTNNGQQTTDNRQRTTDNQQPTTDNGQPTTNEGQTMDEGRRETPAGGYPPGMHPTTPITPPRHH